MLLNASPNLYRCVHKLHESQRKEVTHACESRREGHAQAGSAICRCLQYWWRYSDLTIRLEAIADFGLVVNEAAFGRYFYFLAQAIDIHVNILSFGGIVISPDFR